MIVASLLAALACGYGLALGGWSAEGATLAARYSARVSFYWFMAAWAASSLTRHWPGGWRRTLLARRRAVGLGFAAAHGVHLVALLTAIMWFGRESSFTKIVGGGVGYLFVAAMAITSNDAAVRLLGGRRWRLLHTTGGWIIAAIFAVSYTSLVTIKPLAAVPALTFLLAAVLMRCAVTIRRVSRTRTKSGGAPA
jgi:methionine sulfoxide reductase heme-binding subunit